MDRLGLARHVRAPEGWSRQGSAWRGRRGRAVQILAWRCKAGNVWLGTIWPVALVQGNARRGKAMRGRRSRANQSEAGRGDAQQRRRRYIPFGEKLAAALSCLLDKELRDDLRARKVPASTVISLFDLDHNVLHALDGADKWWNLTPMLRAPHREKARKDTAIVAKVRRIAGESDKWRDILKPKKRKERKRKWPTRKFPKRKA